MFANIRIVFHIKQKNKRKIIPKLYFPHLSYYTIHNTRTTVKTSIKNDHSSQPATYLSTSCNVHHKLPVISHLPQLFLLRICSVSSGFIKRTRIRSRYGAIKTRVTPDGGSKQKQSYTENCRQSFAYIGQIFYFCMP